MTSLARANIEGVWIGEGGVRTLEGRGGAHAAGKVDRSTGERQAGRDGSVNLDARARGGIYGRVAAAEIAVSDSRFAEDVAGSIRVSLQTTEGDPGAAQVFRELIQTGVPLLAFGKSTDKPATTPFLSSFPSPHSLAPEYTTAAQPTTTCSYPQPHATLVIPVTEHPVPRTRSDGDNDKSASSRPASSKRKTSSEEARTPLPPIPPPTDEAWSRMSTQPSISADAVVDLALEADASATTTSEVDNAKSALPSATLSDQLSPPLRGVAAFSLDSDLLVHLPSDAIWIRRLAINDDCIEMDYVVVGEVWTQAQKEYETLTLRFYQLLSNARSKDGRRDATPEAMEHARVASAGEPASAVISRAIGGHPALCAIAGEWTSPALKAALRSSRANGQLMRSLIITSALRDDHSPYDPLPPGSVSPVGDAYLPGLLFLLGNDIARTARLLSTIGYRAVDGLLGVQRAVAVRLVRHGVHDSSTSATPTSNILAAPHDFATNLLTELVNQLLAPAQPATRKTLTARQSFDLLLHLKLLPPGGTYSTSEVLPIGTCIPGTSAPLSANPALWTTEQRSARADQDLVMTACAASHHSRPGERSWSWRRLRTYSRRQAELEAQYLSELEALGDLTEEEEESRAPPRRAMLPGLRGPGKAIMSPERIALAHSLLSLANARGYKLVRDEEELPKLWKLEPTASEIEPVLDLLEDEDWRERVFQPGGISMRRLVADGVPSSLRVFIKKLALSYGSGLLPAVVENALEIVDEPAAYAASIFAHDSTLLCRLITSPASAKGYSEARVWLLDLCLAGATRPTFDNFKAIVAREHEKDPTRPRNTLMASLRGVLEEIVGMTPDDLGGRSEDEAFAIGFFICHSLGYAGLSSGVSTVFVALAHDPEVLAERDPELFAVIRQTYPHVVNPV
ncbi:hypothetical protein AAT19DRAFT_8584 [Rhodotorula toruloides]|uniref:Proteophosphoglycan 5 n=1 Tax=Rhodotorula toruloides TaxID=5286 RepID=A0A2T0AHN8_RHOTO|nr:hypothetical protein AAT19DRAFT_8584 [Rhodotorula toruloides]